MTLREAGCSNESALFREQRDPFDFRSGSAVASSCHFQAKSSPQFIRGIEPCEIGSPLNGPSQVQAELRERETGSLPTSQQSNFRGSNEAHRG
jgi:hypothetical protein